MLGLSLRPTGRIVQGGGGGLPSPTLDYNFRTMTALPPELQFSRTGHAWQYESTGGWLVLAPHNLLPNSQDFSASAWSKASVTATGSVALAPDGTKTADLISGTGATTHASQNVTVVSGATINLSVYAKADTASWIRLRIGGGAETASSWFGQSPASVGTQTSSANLVLSNAVATDVGNGWMRASVTVATTGFTVLAVGVGPVSANGAVGGSGSNSYLWGAQCELYATVRPYLNTSVKNMLGFTEQFDNAAWSKSNLTVSANVSTGPTGWIDADKLITNVGSNTAFVSQTPTYAASTTYTLSTYAKAAEFQYLRLSFGLSGVRMATFDLLTGTVNAEPGLATPSMVPVGNGWWRCAISMPSGAGGAATAAITVNGASTYAATPLTGNGTSGLLIWGAQLASSSSLDPYSVNTGAAAASAIFYGPRFDRIPYPITNLLTNSDGLSNWTTTGVTRTLTAATAPDGATTATRHVATGTGNSNPAVSITVTTGVPYTFSVYYKRESTSTQYVRLRVGASGSNASVFPDVVTGAAGFVGPTTADFTSLSSMTPEKLANGWWRIGITFVSTTASINLAVAPANGLAAGTMVIGDTWQVWGGQLELGSAPQPYVPTVGTAVTGYPTRGLLIEEARTNLAPGLLSDVTYWTALNTTITGGVTGPDNLANAFLVTQSAGGVQSYGANQAATVTVPASTACTVSVFAKAGTSNWLRLLLVDALTATIGASAWFNLSTGVVGSVNAAFGSPTGLAATMQFVGSGWYRCAVTATLGASTTAAIFLRSTSADNTSSDAGSNTMSFYNPQLEVGSFASSPIITTTAAVTRPAENLTGTTLSWFNPNEGTISAGFAYAGINTTATLQTIYSIDDGTANERYTLRASNGSMNSLVVDGNVVQSSLSHGTATTGTVYRTASGHALNDFAVSVNGGAVTTDTAGTLPTVTRLTLGNRLGADYANGWLRRFRVYGRKIDNATLPSISLKEF